MGNPSCPYKCGSVLQLKTLLIPQKDKTMDGRGQFYICRRCGKHWLRSSVISVATARDGVKPKRKDSVLGGIF